MIWSIAWKNVWRKKLRSSLVITSVTLGLFGGVYSFALMLGMVNQRVSSLIDNEISHIQVHNPKYIENSEIKHTINDINKLVSSLEKEKEIKAFSKKTKIFAMANVSSKSNGIVLYGIDIESEKKVTAIHRNIKDSAGTYFEKKMRNPAVIGEKLAKNLKLTYYILTNKTISKLEDLKLAENSIDSLKTLVDIKFRIENKFIDAIKNKLSDENFIKHKFYIVKNSINYKIGSKIIVTTQDINGDLTGGAFKLAGIYKTSNSMFDQTSVFVRNKDLRKVTGTIKTDFHELSIILNNIENSKLVANKLQKQFPELEIETWGEIQPELAVTNEYMAVYYYVFLGIILFSLGFGIINTMLMVVLERVKEIGMLMSIGMNKLKVFLMIMLESVFLSIIGGVIGMIFSGFMIWQTSKAGLNFTEMFGEGFEAIGYSAKIYPEISLNYYFGTVILVVITGIIAAIYPAIKALKLNPAEAIRTDM